MSTCRYSFPHFRCRGVCRVGTCTNNPKMDIADLRIVTLRPASGPFFKLFLNQRAIGLILFKSSFAWRWLGDVNLGEILWNHLLYSSLQKPYHSIVIWRGPESPCERNFLGRGVLECGDKCFYQEPLLQRLCQDGGWHTRGGFTRNSP